LDWTADQGAKNIHTGNYTNTTYTHPTHAGDDIDVDTTALTGATVVSDIDINVTTDTLGHVTDANGAISTRTLTLADLSYTGATDANNYVHPTGAGDKHIPTGGASGQFLKYDSSGTAVWAADNDTVYTLPTADASTLGGIKVGTNLSIASGVLSSTDTNTTYSPGDGLDVSGTTFSLDLKASGGLKITSTELEVEFGSTATTVAQGNHTHSGYEAEGTAVAMAIALG